MINVKTWQGGSAAITDMANAGKRGKTCRVLRFAGAPWASNVGDETQRKASYHTCQIMAAIEGLLPADPAVSFGTAAGIVSAMVSTAQADGVPEHYVACYAEEIRGVDAPVEALHHVVDGVYGATADGNGITLAAHNDPYNEWREITPHNQSDKQAYRLASKVWDKVTQCQTLHEAADVLRAAGCKLHGYCAMD